MEPPPATRTYALTIPTAIFAITAFFLAVAVLLLLFHDLGIENNRIRVTNELAANEPRPKWEVPDWVALHWLALGALLVVSVRALT